MRAQDWVGVLAEVVSSVPLPSTVPGRPADCLWRSSQRVHAGGFLEPMGSQFLLGMCCLHFFSFNKEYVCFRNKVDEVLFKSITKEKSLRARVFHLLPRLQTPGFSNLSCQKIITVTTVHPVPQPFGHPALL